MFLEMVEGRQKVNVQGDHTSETYFPHWIYKFIALDEELGWKRITNEETKQKLGRSVTMSLWSIQTDSSYWPIMSTV